MVFFQNRFRWISPLLCIALTIAAGCASGKKVDPNQRVYVGYYQLDHNVQLNPQQFKNSKMVRPHLVEWAADFSSEFPKPQVIAFQKLNIVPMISWEPRIWNNTNKVISMESIAKGDWDPYIKSWATQIRQVELPVLIAFAAEFNSEVYPWGVPNNKQDGHSYVEAYRHVVSLFRTEGVSNAIFVWTILPVSSPKATWNEPLAYYPGDEYVDWIGLAAVNQQSDMKTMFGEMLANLATNHPQKPIMITRYYFEPGKKSNAAVVKELQQDITSVKAIIFSNPKTLKIDPIFFKQPLFQASVDEFAYLHL